MDSWSDFIGFEISLNKHEICNQFMIEGEFKTDSNQRTFLLSNK